MLCIEFLVALQLPIYQRLEGGYGNVSASTSTVFETHLTGLPAAEHFNSASHSLDDIMVVWLETVLWQKHQAQAI